MSEFRKESFNEEVPTEGVEAIVEMQESAENLLGVIDRQEQHIEDSVESPADKKWLKKNHKRFSLATAVAIGLAVLPLTEGCGRHNETNKNQQSQNSSEQNMERNPKTVVRVIDSDNGYRVRIYSDNTVTAEKIDSTDGVQAVPAPQVEGQPDVVKPEKKEIDKEVARRYEKWASVLSGYMHEEVTPLYDGRYVIKEGPIIKELDENGVAQLNDIVDKFNMELQMGHRRVNDLAKDMVREFKRVIIKCPPVELDASTGQYKVVEKKPIKKLTAEEEAERTKELHEKARQARISLGLDDNGEKKAEEVSDDEKAFRRNPRLRYEDDQDKHRGLTK